MNGRWPGWAAWGAAMAPSAISDGFANGPCWDIMQIITILPVWRNEMIFTRRMIYTISRVCPICQNQASTGIPGGASASSPFVLVPSITDSGVLRELLALSSFAPACHPRPDLHWLSWRFPRQSPQSTRRAVDGSGSGTVARASAERIGGTSTSIGRALSVHRTFSALTQCITHIVASAPCSTATPSRTLVAACETCSTLRVTLVAPAADDTF